MRARRWRTIWVVGLMLILATAVPVSAEPWPRADIAALPDSAFAVVRVRPDGTRARHLPHHDADGRVDVPHLRSALARLQQVHWADPADAEAARQHLRAHEEAFLIGRLRRGPSSGAAHR